MSQPLSIGRIVHFQIERDVWRPAIVTSVHGDGSLGNLTIFLDALNDTRLIDVDDLTKIGVEVIDEAHASVGSAMEGSEPGCWRWPPRA